MKSAKDLRWKSSAIHGRSYNTGIRRPNCISIWTKNKKGVDNQSFFNAEKLTAYENKEQKICAYILFLILLPSTLRSLTKRLYCEM